MQASKQCVVSAAAPIHEAHEGRVRGGCRAGNQRSGCGGDCLALAASQWCGATLGALHCWVRHTARGSRVANTRRAVEQAGRQAGRRAKVRQLVGADDTLNTHAEARSSHVTNEGEDEQRDNLKERGAGGGAKWRVGSEGGPRACQGCPLRWTEPTTPPWPPWLWSESWQPRWRGGQGVTRPARLLRMRRAC